MTNETRELLQELRSISRSPGTSQREETTSKDRNSVVICSVLCMYASHRKAAVFRGYVEHKQ